MSRFVALCRNCMAGLNDICRFQERARYRLGKNLTLRSVMRSFLEADVDYAIQVARNHLQVLERHFDLSRVSILELGPGINFGPQLILASCGARVTVSDRFLSRWHWRYHPKVYRELRAKWSEPAAALDRVLHARGYPDDVISCIAQPAESLSGVADGAFDCVISNAVLEHVYAPRAVATSLARVTKAGGLHFHQVDFRDHKDFRQPLEFLLVGADEYQAQFERTQGVRGNRWRLSEWIGAFESAGFIVVDVQVNDTASDQYLDGFMPRLRDADTVYRDWSEDDLRPLGAHLCFRR